MIWTGHARTRFWKFPTADDAGGGGTATLAGATDVAATPRAPGLTEDRADGAEVGDAIATTEKGVRVTKSGEKKGVPSVAQAGAALLEQLKKSGADAGDDDDAAGADDDEAGDAAVDDDKEKPAPGAPAKKPDAKADADTAGETAEEKSAREAIEAAEAELVKHETPAETDARHMREQAELAGKKKDKDASATTVRIVLPGLAEKGEKDLALDVDDPEIVKYLQRLANNGLRRRAFDEQSRKVEEKAAQIRAVETALATDPVAFAIHNMTPKRQVEVARVLLLEHFDVLADDIARYTENDADRQKDRVALRDRMKDSGDVLAETTSTQQRAAAIMGAARALIPDDVDETTAQEFILDAEQDLIREAKTGRAVAPSDVPAILARRLERYGFPAVGSGEDRSARSERVPANGTRPRPAGDGTTARPLSDKAREIAEQRLAEARAAQARIKRGALARRSAAKVAQPGAGAGAISRAVIPPKADVREASKAVLKSLPKGASWEQATARK